MTKYIMRFNSNTVSLAWEYHYEMSSDKLALDYACRHAILLAQDLAVFKQEIDDEYSFLGEIITNTQTTARIVS